MKLERYSGVRGRANVAKVTEALRRSGAKILSEPDPRVAPFEYAIELPNGERRQLVCYAFTANKYGQQGRPDGEHRFQIKYGGDFQRYHELFIDPSRDRNKRKITLLFGVHHELDLFVAVDPLMHTPTWFSMSVEFKDEDLQRARRAGWHAWERERAPGRRKERPILPMESFQTEAVTAFTPEHFLHYVEFEHLASGLDAAERVSVGAELARAPSPGKKGHRLENELGISREELLDLLDSAFRLKVAVRGRVAEHHLGKKLDSLRGVSSVRSLDEDGQPDFELVYRKRTFRIECKNVRREIFPPRVDFQKTRAAKGNPCSRYYSSSQFEVLAACMHPVTAKWDFTFCATSSLAPHKKCNGKLSDKVVVGGATWSDSLTAVLDTIP